MSNPADKYTTRTLYLRERIHDNGSSWECMAKSDDGRGVMLTNLETRDLAIRSMTFLLWGMNTFSPEEYGTEMEKCEGAPEGVEFPVIEEDPICS